MNRKSAVRSGLRAPARVSAALLSAAFLVSTCSDDRKGETGAASGEDGGRAAGVGSTSADSGSRSAMTSGGGTTGPAGGVIRPGGSGDETAADDAGAGVPTSSGGAAGAGGGAGIGSGGNPGKTPIGAAGTASNGGASGAGGAVKNGGAAGTGRPHPGAGGSGTDSGGRPNSGGSNHPIEADAAADLARPCDVYAAGETPCVAAHSTVRSLYASYAGSLYQVRRSSDNTTRDIGVSAPGGFASAAAQDTFCTGTTCVITKLYDQSGHGNDLEYQGEGSSCGGKDKPATATTESLNVGGNKVYALYINPGNSYWRDGHKTGVPTDSAPEGMYMVTSGTHVNSGCCFDYGNSETDRKADGAGAMDAIYFGTSCWFGGCTGAGPWVQADLEYGLYPGGSSSWNSKQVAFTNRYVTALLKNNGTSKFALKGGNAQSGSLTTLWDGSLPGGYSPMKKQGAIVLGSGGDCCATNTNMSDGTFYEGAMVAGYPSDATDAAVQSNIVAAGYGTSP